LKCQCKTRARRWPSVTVIPWQVAPQQSLPPLHWTSIV
jgi:hypothetical protein